MAAIFPKWMNRLPAFVAIGGSVLLVGTTLAVSYFFSPSFTDVGYQPKQPVDFSHRLHAGELTLDCRYCHAMVEVSPVATVPPTKVCMNCHALVKQDSELLVAVRESAATGQPIAWVRVHDLPDYAYFDHSVHIAAEVDCSTCHGDVASMDEIRQVETLSMSWCLDCHRDPSLGTDKPGLSPSTDCTACHR